MTALLTLLNYLMTGLGAKPNGSKTSFNVDLTFVRALVVLVSFLLALTFSAGSMVPKAHGMAMKLCGLEQSVVEQKQEISSQKKELADFKSVMQTQNAVIISKLETLTTQLTNMQNAMYDRRR